MTHRGIRDQGCYTHCTNHFLEKVDVAKMKDIPLRFCYAARNAVRFAVDYFCLDNLSNLLQNEILTCMILVLSIPTTSAKKTVICWPFLVSSAHSLPSLLNSRPILSFFLPVTVFVIIF